jgi:hypothetical protein
MKAPISSCHSRSQPVTPYWSKGHRAWLLTLIATAFLSSACTSANEHPAESQPLARNEDQIHRLAKIDDLAICDCLLPGSIIGQGTRVVRQAPGHLVRTSVRDCRIRGGKYSVDPADYTIRFKQQLPLANEGDVEAQTIVGEMYEKGLGVSRSYPEAARWYRRAAEGGSTRAALNLGNLIEHGLGVPKNPQEAAAWYRRALGSNVQITQPVDAGPPPKPGPTAPPVIRLTEPRLVAARNQTAQMAIVEPDIGRVVIIGRVISSRAIRTLTVNGTDIRAKIQPDGRNDFRHEITLRGPEELVSIVATDQSGLASSLQFRIRNRSGKGLGTTPSPGSYHALVVGNSRYRQLQRLDTPENDAREVDGVLREKYGFRVTTRFDQTQEELLDLLEKLRAGLGDNDNLLIYYAGHCKLAAPNLSLKEAAPTDVSGEQLMPYWLPVDADPSDSTTWISGAHVTQVIDAMQARQVLIVADSCPLEARPSSVASVPPDISDKERAAAIMTLAGKRARVIIASGGAPKTIRKNDQHSIFAESFIEVLGKNVGPITGLEMFEQLKQRILILEGPISKSPVTFAPIRGTVGDFVLVRRGAN